jgi:hypothetical protein
MNIYTVRDNLKNTIVGKEFLLSKMQNGTESQDPVDRSVSKATQSFLTINIDELKRILEDVEQCCTQATEQSWRDNPDRMGGQYTQEELYDPNRTNWIEP